VTPHVPVPELPPGRRANLIIPISLDGHHVCQMQVTLSENDARIIAEADEEWADRLGELFRVVRDSFEVFLLSQGNDHDHTDGTAGE
jgi:hypothetical protein